jgi:hypothetical protein
VIPEEASSFANATVTALSAVFELLYPRMLTAWNELLGFDNQPSEPSPLLNHDDAGIAPSFEKREKGLHHADRGKEVVLMLSSGCSVGRIG